MLKEFGETLIAVFYPPTFNSLTEYAIQDITRDQRFGIETEKFWKHGLFDIVHIKYKNMCSLNTGICKLKEFFAMRLVSQKLYIKIL